MDKITFCEFKQVMACDLNMKVDPCIEILFCIDGCKVYSDVWITKVIDKHTQNNIYGFGLALDGSQEYNYTTFEKFATAKIFYGRKSLKDIWGSVSIILLDGGQVEETLPYFLR